MSSSLSDSLTAAPSSLRLSEMLRPFMYAVWVLGISFPMAFSILLL